MSLNSMSIVSDLKEYFIGIIMGVNFNEINIIC